MDGAPLKTPDAGHSWVDALPRRLQPWLRLMRADRPVGVWLLFLPCLWGLALASAAETTRDADALTVAIYAALFAIGAFVMRSAGCAYNDIVDRDLDAKVARTALRPLPSGQLTVTQAWALVIFLCLTGLAVLLCFNTATVITGVVSLGLVATYPFMKRITYWPQIWLGLTFNWGILMGWTAITGSLSLAPVLLYLGAAFWTIGYDTIYAHQDREDDALIGVKSSALALGPATRRWLILFYGAMALLITLAGLSVGLSVWFHVGMLAVALHLGWQALRLDTSCGETCLGLFKCNRETGLMVLLALLMGQL